MTKFGKVSLLLLAGAVSMASAAYYGENPDRRAANALSEIGQSIGAEGRALEAVKENPYDGEAWVTLGSILEESARVEESLAAFERAARLLPDRPEVRIKVAEINLRLARTDTAEAIVKEFLGENPFYLPAIRLSGWIALHRAAGDARSIAGFSPKPEFLAKASAAFERALKVEPRDVESMTGRGLASHWSGDRQAALVILDEALAIDTTSYWAWQIKGEVLESLRRDKDAWEAFQMANRHSADRPYTASALAGLARRQDMFQEAAAYTRSMGSEGAYSEGASLMAAGDFTGAETAFLSALGFDPEDDLALDKLEEVRTRIYPADDARRVALAERRLQEAAKAESVRNILLAYFNYVRAVKLAPQLSHARLQLARFYEKIGAYGSAAEELARVDELTRSQNERIVASDLLERITRTALSEMESVHAVDFREVWEEPTSVLGKLISDPETLESRIRWGVNPVARPRVRIAVLPFREALPPSHAEVGRYAAESLATTLGLFPGFELVPQKEIQEALKRFGGSANAADIGRLSRDLNADMVIRGRIFEERENVAVEAEIVRAPGGPIVGEYRISTRGPQSLSRALLEISRGASASLPLKGKVVRRRSGATVTVSTVTVNLGRIQGISLGDTIAVLQPRREIYVAGFDWAGQRDETVAVGRVVGLTEQYCEVLPVDGAARIRAGDIAARLAPKGRI